MPPETCYIVYVNYYEVLVGDLQFHGQSALTYASEERLKPGCVVRIALRSRAVLGLVLRQVPEPSFAAKPIAAITPFPPVPTELLQLVEWLYGYYPAPFGTVIRQFLPPTTAFPKHEVAAGSRTRKASASEKQVGAEKAIHERSDVNTFGGASPSSNNEISPKTNSSLPPLTSEQNEAIKQIEKPGSYLLHGVTGSGKTRVYQELAARALAAGRSVIILTPEIGLTEHMVQSFKVFDTPAYVLHSRLTDATRRDIWYRILAEDSPCIVIGPRSALFAPVHDVGLIVMDEAHDQAYKSDSSPRYRTDRIASYLAHLHGAVFVAGSATPNVEDMHISSEKGRPVVRLSHLARENDITNDIKLMVDMRDQTNLSRSRVLTLPLIEAVHDALSRGEQALLFLNRRGTAAAVLCSHCGWRAVCPTCDLPLTYHGDAHKVRCHACGRQYPLPATCPDCNQIEILLKSIGTKAVVEEAQRLFPAARIRRFDTDTDKSDQIESQLAALQAGETDILVGTQMIAKGLDLPKLAVVGVLNADASLLIPDFSAAERTYQLLAQVAGRVGRGHRRGTVIVQTYDPASPLLRDALDQNWQSFYDRELAERRAFRYPPYTYMLKLWCLRASSASAEKTATKLSEQIQKTHPRVKIDGPAPSFHPRESGKYRWQLIVRSPSRSALVDIVRSLPSGWQHDLDPTNLL